MNKFKSYIHGFIGKLEIYINKRNIIFIFLILLLFCLPKSVQGKEIIIKSTNGKPVVINEVIGVTEDDTLRIYSGTKIVVGPDAGFYVRGLLFMGLEDDFLSAGNTNTSSTTNKSKTITIVSSSTLPFIEVDGGSVIGTDLNFKGTVFAAGYRNAEIAISSSSFMDTTAGIIFAHQPFFAMYQNSKLDLSYSTIFSQVDPNNPGSTQPRQGYENVIGYGGYPLKSNLFEVYSESHATITETKIHSDISPAVFEVYNDSRIHFDNSHIISCERWLRLFNQSTATGQLNNPVCVEQAELVFTGATSTINYQENGCCASVLFIPGFQGSRLYKKQVYENRLWEPNIDGDVQKLFMNTLGQSIQSDIYAKDILSRVEIAGYGINKLSYYHNFLASLEKIKSENLIQEYRSFPYDWRYSPEEIVTQNLINQIEQLSKNSINGRVTIVAHSYGGLVSKVLLRKLKETRRAHLIDKVVLVAVPETGTPTALFAALHGENQTIMKGIIQKASTAISLAQNMPSAYVLMPSAIFARNIALTMNISARNVDTSFGLSKPSYMGEVIGWLKQVTGEPAGLNLTKDSILVQKTSNSFLQSKATGEVSRLIENNNLVNNSYKIWSLAGIGVQTIDGMRYEYDTCALLPCKKPSTLTAVPSYIVDGDGTVILDSPQNRLGTLLKIDLSKLNSDKKTNIRHSNIMESTDIQSTIKSILLSNNPVEQNGFIYLDDTHPEVSELYMTVVDGEVSGGIAYSFEGKKYETITLKQNDKFYIIEDIPNSSITKMGNMTALTSQVKPDDMHFVSTQNQRISIANTIIQNSPTGNWNGPEINQTNNSGANSNQSTYVFDNIPVGSSAEITFSTTSPIIYVDIDGDGDPEREYEAEIPPIITSSTSTKIQIMMSDLAKVLNVTYQLQDEINQLEVYAHKSTYSKKISNSRGILLSAQNNFIKFFGADGLIIHSLENQIISKESEKILIDLEANEKVIERLLEQEALYKSQVENIDEYIIERGARGVSAATLAKKANALMFLRDISYLYIIYSDLIDAELEFLALHGTISSERLQRP